MKPRLPKNRLHSLGHTAPSTRIGTNSRDFGFRKADLVTVGGRRTLSCHTNRLGMTRALCHGALSPPPSEGGAPGSERQYSVPRGRENIPAPECVGCKLLHESLSAVIFFSDPSLEPDLSHKSGLELVSPPTELFRKRQLPVSGCRTVSVLLERA